MGNDGKGRPGTAAEREEMRGFLRGLFDSVIENIIETDTYPVAVLSTGDQFQHAIIPVVPNVSAVSIAKVLSRVSAFIIKNEDAILAQEAKVAAEAAKMAKPCDCAACAIKRAVQKQMGTYDAEADKKPAKAINTIIVGNVGTLDAVQEILRENMGDRFTMVGREPAGAAEVASAFVQPSKGEIH
jgi:hypothetical protein